MPSVITSQDFNRHISQAQRNCETEPVFITNRGRLAYVLLNYEEYRRLSNNESIAEALSAPAEMGDMIDLEFERSHIEPRVFPGE